MRPMRFATSIRARSWATPARPAIDSVTAPPPATTPSSPAPSAPAASTGGILRLGAFAHGRANNFQLIRFLAAGAVVLFHCFALTNHWTDEPLWKLAPELNF